MADFGGTTLDELFALIASRKGGDPAASYTAKLLAEGAPAIAKKLGEEAIETIIEAVKGDPARLAAESADLLYHLLVLWVASGVTPDRVWRLLEARKGQSGLAEKAARPPN
jgi:phosphoribosyl-ATP pyrophosphohydrolase